MVKYQNIILTSIGSVVIIVFVILLSKFYYFPKSQEATSELNQAQYYFELAVNDKDSDSLYRRALTVEKESMVF